MLVRALMAAGTATEPLLGSIAPSARRQRATLAETAHRPWPLPGSPWVMGQTWENLLFAHWPVAISDLEPVVPKALPIDVFDGSAWVGVTPFRVVGLRLRGTAPAPVASRFPELNVRTYVVVEDKPGIYFFSLDAGSSAAVAAARRLYRLPYFRSRMAVEMRDDWVIYSSERRQGHGTPAEFAGRYRPRGVPAPGERGSLAHWLTERYCLYTLDASGRVLRGEIHHPPWPLQDAELDLERNTMGEQVGLRLQGEPLVHFAGRQDVVLWALAPGYDRTRE